MDRIKVNRFDFCFDSNVYLENDVLIAIAKGRTKWICRICRASTMQYHRSFGWCQTSAYRIPFRISRYWYGSIFEFFVCASEKWVHWKHCSIWERHLIFRVKWYRVELTCPQPIAVEIHSDDTYWNCNGLDSWYAKWFCDSVVFAHQTRYQCPA